jgi:hypothetical protein
MTFVKNIVTLELDFTLKLCPYLVIFFYLSINV